MSLTRRLIPLAAASLLALGVAACGGGDTKTVTVGATPGTPGSPPERAAGVRHRRCYGDVVDSVEPSVLACVPVRRLSAAPVDWRKAISYRAVGDRG